MISLIDRFSLAFRALRAAGLAVGLGVTALAAYYQSRQGQMASRNYRLDATVGREVVYCHQCQHEWFHDDRPDTLDCPRCMNQCTEIVRLLKLIAISLFIN